MNPEESTFFCMGPAENGCWHLTLVMTRPLKVLYFDGSSAAKLDSGTMDTQDVLTWGKGLLDKTWMEQERIAALCEWGNQYRDGNGLVPAFHVRTYSIAYAEFSETMVCNFTAGLEVVSFLHLASPDPLDVPPVTESRAILRTFESLHAGSWSTRFPGELRIQLDLSNIMTRTWFPLSFLRDEDILRAKTRVEELARPRELSSGVDWMALIRTIVYRYASRLELMQYLLRSIAWDDSRTILDAARKTRVQLRVSLTPHILLNAAPLEGSNSLDWARPTLQSCATSHITRLEGLDMTPSEKLLFQAVEGRRKRSAALSRACGHPEPWRGWTTI
ncbi:hypothetical protein PISMIDRAFT_13881 [Pisolithus microcarpus 441]|uniref:Uncharacterized protein n=1 Tax=Pisolithus microcarpus 441 TaxID=765257 RepID=A0A0C9YYU5_9AGAM|nr:hypothetical protein PISMIDRAFT_13881 [Pisolithus microcarpus 441]